MAFEITELTDALQKLKKEKEINVITTPFNQWIKGKVVSQDQSNQTLLNFSKDVSKLDQTVDDAFITVKK